MFLTNFVINNCNIMIYCKKCLYCKYDFFHSASCIKVTKQTVKKERTWEKSNSNIGTVIRTSHRDIETDAELHSCTSIKA